ncbi:hypothetical protein HK096_003583, partial [Nowakowskiella sp. JEL0078]
MFNFGANNNNNNPQSLFGAPAAAPAFGQPQQPTGFGFGASGFGFGANTAAARPASLFGATPANNNTSSAFGAPATSGIFGAGPTTGMFGAPAQNTTPAFGSANTFGAAAPAFGASASAFGAPAANTGFGANTAVTQPGSWNSQNGTGNPTFRQTQEQPEPGTRTPQNQLNYMHSISAMPEYMKFSFEELRCRDYELGKKYAGSGNTFGANKANTGFGFGAKPATSAFAVAANPAFGGATPAFGAATSAPAFGATPAFGANPTFGATPAFGAATTPAFGSNAAPAFGAAAAAAPAFGTNTTTPFGQPNNTGGLFGATSTAPSMFGAAPTSATPSAGFFGGGAGAFRSTATTTPAAGFGAGLSSVGMFGKPATTTPAFGASTAGLFNNATPAAGAFGSAFNKPATTSAFGGGFGAPAPATGGFLGGGLGGIGGTQPTNAFGIAAPATGGMFGGLGGGLGNSLAPTTAFGVTTAPTANNGFSFGANVSKPGNFSFASTPATGLGTSGYNPGTAGFNGLGTNAGFASSVIAPQNALQASIDRQPYGYNPLFNVALKPQDRPPAQSQGLIVPTTPGQKKPALTPVYKLTPRTSAKVKLRGFASPAGGRTTPSATSAGHLFDGSSRDDSVLGFNSNGQFVPRRNVKKLDLDVPDEQEQDKGKGKDSELSTMFPVNTHSGVTPLKKVIFDPNREEAVQNVVQNFSTSAPFTLTPAKSLANSPAPTTTPSKPTPKKSPAPSPVSQSPNRRIAPSEYILSPPLEQLMKYPDAELRAIEDFSLSVPGFGSIKFLKPVDLLSASPTGDKSGIKLIPGHVVLIAKQVVEVYPVENYDEDSVPPVGLGLNVEAEIELDGCWAIDKATREPVKDETDPRFENR